MTLTQAALFTKRGLIISFVLLFLGMAAFIGYKVWYGNYLSHLPKVEEKPEMKFGTLPKLVFPKNSISSSNYSYSLDTVTGGLPKLPKLIKVYFIPQVGVSLLSSDKSKGLASKLSFENGPEILSETLYKFSDEMGNELLIDVPSGNFHFQRIKIASNSSDIQNSLPDQNKIINLFRKYLSDKNLLPEGLSDQGVVTYNQLPPQIPQTAQVSLLPNKVDNLPIINPTLKDGLVKATITQYEEEMRKFTKVDYIFWPVDLTTYSTYPIKTPQQAFDDLKSGQGFIIAPPEKPQVSISSVYLAYFETEEYSPYLQPIYVFEGPNFTALIPAISPK